MDFTNEQIPKLIKFGQNTKWDRLTWKNNYRMDLCQFQHHHTNGSVKSKSRTWCISETPRTHLSAVKWNRASLEALFPSWSSLRCFAKKPSLKSLGSSSKIMNSSTLAFSIKNEEKLMSDLVPRYQLNTIVFRRMSRHLIRLWCLWRHSIFSFFDCDWKRTWTNWKPAYSVKYVDQIISWRQWKDRYLNILRNEGKWRIITSM